MAFLDTNLPVIWANIQADFWFARNNPMITILLVVLLILVATLWQLVKQRLSHKDISHPVIHAAGGSGGGGGGGPGGGAGGAGGAGGIIIMHQLPPK